MGSSTPDAERNSGDRIMGLADFGKPTGRLGTVEKTNEDDALVKRDDDGRCGWFAVPVASTLPNHSRKRNNFQIGLY